MPSYHINVGTAGQLNVNPEVVNNIQAKIEAISTGGSIKTAEAIKQLTEAVLQAQESDETQRTELINNIEDLATELQTSAPKRSRIRAFAAAISAASPTRSTPDGRRRHVRSE